MKNLLLVLGLLALTGCSTDAVFEGQVDGLEEPTYTPSYKGQSDSSIVAKVRSSSDEVKGLGFFYESKGANNTSPQYLPISLIGVAPDEEITVILPVENGLHPQTIEMRVFARGIVRQSTATGLPDAADKLNWPTYPAFPEEAVLEQDKEMADKIAFTPADSISPTVVITQGPNDPTNNSSVSFIISASDNSGSIDRFECSLDGAGFVPCTTATPANPREDRVVAGFQQHTMVIAAFDADDNRGESAPYQWTLTNGSLLGCTVDAVSPVFTSVSSRTLTYTCDNGGGPAIDTYQCRYKRSIDSTWIDVPCNAGGATVSGYTDNGLYDFQVAITNTEGTQSNFTSTVNFGFDNLAPTVNFTCPGGGNDGFIQNAAGYTAPTCSDTGVGICSAECSLDNGNTFSAASCSPDLSTSQAYAIFIRATDSIGNQSAPAISCNFTVDGVKPTVTIVGADVAEGGTTAPGTLNFDVAYSDNSGASSFDHYDCEIENGSGGITNYNNCSDPFAVTLNTEDNFIFRVFATDKAGNRSDATTRSFTLEDNSPRCNFTKFTRLNGTDFLKAGFVTETQIQAHLTCDRPDNTPATGFCSFTDAASVASCGTGDIVVTSPVLAEGDNSFFYTYDQAQPAIEQAFKVDSVDPVVTCPSPALAIDAGMPIADLVGNATCNDGADGPNDSLCIGTIACQMVDGTPCSDWLTNNPTPGAGTYPYRLSSEDNAGNSSNVAACNLSVTQPPSVEFVMPDQDIFWIDDEFEFEWLAKDPSGNDVTNQASFRIEVLDNSCQDGVGQNSGTAWNENKYRLYPIDQEGIVYLRVVAIYGGKESIPTCSPRFHFKRFDLLNKLVVGHQSNCILGRSASSNKPMRCWGKSGSGLELIGFSGADQKVPQVVGDAAVKTRDISIGSEHSCQVVSEANNGSSNVFDRVECWGNNASEKVGVQNGNCAPGNCTFGERKTIKLLPFVKPIQVAVGANHSCALVLEPTNGTTKEYWVHNDSLGVDWTDKNFMNVADNSWDGNSFSVPTSPDLVWDTGVYCWGQMTQGAIGYCEDLNVNIAEITNLDALVDEVPSTGGCRSSYRRNTGNNDTMRKITETYIPHPVFYQDDGKRLRGMVELDAGAQFTCALESLKGALEGGRMHCWGNNQNRQIVGRGTESTRASMAFSDESVKLLKQFDLGKEHGCAVKVVGTGANNGTLYCWGRNDNYEIKLSSTNKFSDQEPILNFTTTDALMGSVIDFNDSIAAKMALPGKQIALGDDHTCVLDGGVPRCWGSTANGRLGNVDPTDAKKWILGNTGSRGANGMIPEPENAGQPSQHIHSYKDHWNANAWDAYWNAKATNSDGSPMSQADFNSITASCTDPGNTAWGLQAAVISENFDQASQQLPRSCTNIDFADARYIAAGEKHTCVVKTVDDPGTPELENSIYCFGEGSAGRLGYSNVDTSDQFIPTRVAQEQYLVLQEDKDHIVSP